MNEHIRQLAEQSQLWDRLDPRSLGIPGGSTESRWGEELQEFAELIVRECAGIVEDYGLSLVGSDENYLGETLNLSIRVQEAGNKIKKHFGVEE